jgi:hypothetical protein
MIRCRFRRGALKIVIVVVDDVDDLEGDTECRWQRKKGELAASTFFIMFILTSRRRHR